MTEDNYFTSFYTRLLSWHAWFLLKWKQEEWLIVLNILLPTKFN